jgi:hypothetical protein
LERLGATYQAKNCYELSLLDFNILPKSRSNKAKTIPVTYPDIPILPNDIMDKETCIYFTQEDRKNKILHIFTEDEFFLHRCKKLYLPYADNEFISYNHLKAFAKKAKLSEEERVMRAERMREAKKLAMLNT